MVSLKLTSLNKFDKSLLEFQIIANDNYFNKDKRKFNQYTKKKKNLIFKSLFLKSKYYNLMTKN